MTTSFSSLESIDPGAGMEAAARTRTSTFLESFAEGAFVLKVTEANWVIDCIFISR